MTNKKQTARLIFLDPTGAYKLKIKELMEKRGGLSMSETFRRLVDKEYQALTNPNLEEDGKGTGEEE